MTNEPARPRRGTLIVTGAGRGNRRGDGAARSG
jgi:hypothetical protein